MKKIAFVILTWNSSDYIEKCINSINTISNFKTQIIIIDNGSKDKTIEILKKYKKIMTNLNVVYLSKNMGTTESRNIGLKLVDDDTDYICILDSDTVINENAMEVMAEYLSKNNDVGLVGPAMVNEKNEKQIPYRKFPSWKIKILKAIPIKKISKIGEKLESYKDDDMVKEIECDYLISACWLMRNEIYSEIGGLDEKIFYSPEDVEYCLRVRSKGYKVVHLKQAKIIHLYQRISKKKLISKVNFSHLIGINYVLRKYKKFLKEYRKR